MPLPVFLFALWALWPIAAHPGGKLFAPLVFLIGLFALKSIGSARRGPAVWTGIVLLLWVCVSAFWSPAGEGVFSGSLVVGNFAVEASYIRFSSTIIGCYLFLNLVTNAPAEKLTKVPNFIYLGIGTHLVLVCFMALSRESLLLSQGDFLVPTGQSMGRNANLLGLGVALVLGGLALTGKRGLFWAGGCALVALTVISTMMLDGLAAVFGLILGGVAFGFVWLLKKNGFRALFNLAAIGVLFAPVLAWGLSGIAPSLVGSIPLTAQQRILIWQATLERILEKPFFGHGVNATPTWVETYASRPEFLEQLMPELINKRIIPNHPHNMPLQIWVETGLVGAALCAVILVLAGRALPAPETLSTGVKIAGAGIFGAGLSYFAVSYSVWDESYWASIAIVLSGVIALHRKAQMQAAR